MINDNLACVFNDTRKLSKTKFKDATDRLKEETLIYPNRLVKISNSDKLTDVWFTGTGTVSAGYTLCDTYNRVALLNFANPLIPGGFVNEGAIAQEESICRCSNLYESLIEKECYSQFYSFNKFYSNSGIGLYTESVIYSPDVLLFKDDVIYNECDAKAVDVLTCSAPSAKLSDDQALYIFKSRITKILTIAICNEVDSIVLGAWGCGVFRQSVSVVAQAFAEVLNDLSGYFKNVTFAIRQSAKSSTYAVFKSVFSEYYKGEVRV